jgi:hypothetical protein
MELEGCLKVGPWGGEGGKHWSFKAKKGSITEIVVLHGEAIDSISFKSDDGDGAFEYSDKFGGEGGRSDKAIIILYTSFPHKINTVTIFFACFFVTRN